MSFADSQARCWYGRSIEWVWQFRFWRYYCRASIETLLIVLLVVLDPKTHISLCFFESLEALVFGTRKPGNEWFDFVPAKPIRCQR